ncbi:MAG TPA: hypothetical protein VFT41_04045 [Gemmatimonadaceae bacterium]|nr:hypothetical protein [Gemmatimonadaceae bacterium]
MPGLVQVLFPDPPLVRTPRRLLRWWEAHRLTYNLVVGGAGLLTLGVANALSLLPGPMHRAFFHAWPAVIVYALAANLCYSAGWIVESLVQRWLRRDTYGLGPALFRHGLVFSVGLTLLPAVVLPVAWVASLIFR